MSSLGGPFLVASCSQHIFSLARFMDKWKADEGGEQEEKQLEREEGGI